MENEIIMRGQIRFAQGIKHEGELINDFFQEDKKRVGKINAEICEWLASPRYIVELSKFYPPIKKIVRLVTELIEGFEQRTYDDDMHEIIARAPGEFLDQLEEKCMRFLRIRMRLIEALDAERAS